MKNFKLSISCYTLKCISVFFLACIISYDYLFLFKYKLCIWLVLRFYFMNHFLKFDYVLSWCDFLCIYPTWVFSPRVLDLQVYKFHQISKTLGYFFKNLFFHSTTFRVNATVTLYVRYCSIAHTCPVDFCRLLFSPWSVLHNFYCLFFQDLIFFCHV